MRIQIDALRALIATKLLSLEETFLGYEIGLVIGENLHGFGRRVELSTLSMVHN